jgi:hypothetical protein
MKIAIGIICATLIPCLSQGASVYADNFDNDTSGVNATPSGWTISNGGTVDIIPNGSFGISCFGSSGNCIDLDGSTGKSGDLVSPGLTLTADQSYVATFELSGNQRNAQTDTVTVDFGTKSTSFSVTESAPFTLESVSFTPVSSGLYNLSFLDSSSNDVGAILDQVSIQTASIVPVPAAAWLLLSGLGGLCAFARKKPGVSRGRPASVLTSVAG